jgi:hypothetical protein
VCQTEASSPIVIAIRSIKNHPCRSGARKGPATSKPINAASDPIFDRLTARNQAGALIPDAEVSTNSPQPRIGGKMTEHHRASRSKLVSISAMTMTSPVQTPNPRLTAALLPPRCLKLITSSTSPSCDERQHLPLRLLSAHHRRHQGGCYRSVT